MSIYKKLQQARTELHAKKLEKTGNNNGKPFFELGDFLPESIKLFNAIGLCEVISFTSELATMTIHDTDSDATIVITSPFGSADLRGCHAVQNIGAVETYQRRYLWMTAMDIIEHDGLETAGAPVEQFDALPYIAKMEAADTKESLDKAYSELIADCKGKVDSSDTKAYGTLKERLSRKFEELSDTRFANAIAQVIDGKISKASVSNYKLTDAQIKTLEESVQGEKK